MPRPRRRVTRPENYNEDIAARNLRLGIEPFTPAVTESFTPGLEANHQYNMDQDNRSETSSIKSMRTEALEDLRFRNINRFLKIVANIRLKGEGCAEAYEVNPPENLADHAAAMEQFNIITKWLSKIALIIRMLDADEDDVALSLAMEMEQENLMILRSRFEKRKEMFEIRQTLVAGLDGVRSSTAENHETQRRNPSPSIRTDSRPPSRISIIGERQIRSSGLQVEQNLTVKCMAPSIQSSSQHTRLPLVSDRSFVPEKNFMPRVPQPGFQPRYTTPVLTTLPTHLSTGQSLGLVYGMPMPATYTQPIYNVMAPLPSVLPPLTREQTFNSVGAHPPSAERGISGLTVNETPEGHLDLSYDTLDQGDWRALDYFGENIEVIELVHKLGEAGEMIARDPATADDLLLRSLEKEGSRLSKLKDDIGKLLRTVSKETYVAEWQGGRKGYEETSNYLKKLRTEIRKRGMDTAGDSKRTGPLNLTPFDGFKSKNTNIYEFLQQFKMVTREHLPEDRKEYLYANYLSDEVRAEVKHVRHSFELMERELLDKYGDINKILLERRSQLKKLTPPAPRASDEVKQKYFSSYREVLLQMQALAERNKVSYPELEREIYNHNRIMEVVSLMPKYYRDQFCTKYVKQSKTKGCDSGTGKETFDLFHEFLTFEIARYNLNITLTPAEEERKEDKDPKKKLHTSNQGSDNDRKNRKRTEKMKKSSPYHDKWVWASCFMHKDDFRLVRDCKMGECKLFLEANPEKRLQMAEARKRCGICLLWKCKNLSQTGSCFFVKDVPASLICTPCSAAGIERNILLCSQHSSDCAQVRKDLCRFLPGYVENTGIKIMTLGIHQSIKEIVNSSKRVGKTGATNNNAYNVSDGSILDVTDMKHKVRPPIDENAIYPLQTLCIGGKSVLCMYDTGASGEIIKVNVAEECKFNIFDPEPQFIYVASGMLVPTGGCMYSAVLGPDRSGKFHTVVFTGMTKITEKVPYYDIKQMVAEFKNHQSSTPLAKENMPPAIGGEEVGMIIGVRQSWLVPELLLVLPSGLQVWRSQFKDIYDSDLIFAGPHPEITAQDKLANRVNRINIMRTELYKSYLNSLHTGRFMKITPPQCGGSLCLEDTIEPRVANVCEVSQTPVNVESDETPAEETEIVRDFADLALLTAIGSDVELKNLEYKEAAAIVCMKCKTPIEVERNLAEHEDAGIVVDYRCSKCQDCSGCKASDRTRDISLRELVEEELIQESVSVDYEKKTTYCTYPFIRNVDQYLSGKWNGKMSNKHVALKVLNSQRGKNQQVRQSIIKFHDEMKEKGFVKRVKDLPESLQRQIYQSPLQHYFAWRNVFKEGSTSTPCRMVVDPTVSMFNDTIAKGVNCLNNLYSIVAQWRLYPFVFTSDVSKMYNVIKLRESEYRYSLYLFSDNLDPGEEAEDYVMLTLFYGLRSAANQATCGLRKLALHERDSFPKGADVILNKTYMDDSSGGAFTRDELDEIIGEVTTILPKGGFTLKAVCVSGEVPPEKMTQDGFSSTYCGYKWFQKDDLMSLNHGDMNFNPKRRGTKKPNEFPVETDEDVDLLLDNTRLTRRKLLGKTLEVYDILGLFEPLKAKLKLDLQLLKDMSYDDEIPLDLKDDWIGNLKLINSARRLRCRRAVVPLDAVDPYQIHLLAASDAGARMAGTAVYARFMLNNGLFSCQLLTARSKGVHETIPRNELNAALLAAQTLHILSKALKERVSSYLLVVDSEVALLWCSNLENRLKAYVFDRVRKIHRLVDHQRMFHIKGVMNPADILTKGRFQLEDLDLDGPWQNGEAWMSLPEESMPIRSASQLRVCLNPETNEQLMKETVSARSKESFDQLGVQCSTSQETSEADETNIVQPAEACNIVPEVEIVQPLEAAGLVPEVVTVRPHEASKIVPEVGTVQPSKVCELAPEAVTVQHSKVCNKVLEAEDIRPSEACEVVPQVESLQVSKESSLATEKTDLSNVTCNTDKKGRTDLAKRMKVGKEQIKKKPVKYCDNFLIDPIYYGFKKTVVIIAYLIRFIMRARHKSHKKTNSKLDWCKMCQLQDTVFKSESLGVLLDGENLNVTPSSYDIHEAWRFLCAKATEEVRRSMAPSKLKKFIEDGTGILKSGGRLSYPEVARERSELPYFEDIRFVCPVATRDSKLTISLSTHLHWNVLNHPGVERLLGALLRIVHVENVRPVIRRLRDTCSRCRILLKRRFEGVTGNQSKLSLLKAPPFFSTMTDICGNFQAYDVKSRTTKMAYMIIFCCMITSAVSIHCLEDLSTDSIVFAITRFASRYGYPKFLVLDNQTSFVALNKMTISYRDLKGRLWNDRKITLEFSTPYAHESHGRVESRVKILKDLLEKTSELGRKHSFLQWETVCANLAGFMNNMPLARCQDTGNVQDDEFGLITPARMLLGRNNDVSPDGPVLLEGTYTDRMDDVISLTNGMLDILQENLHRFVPGKVVQSGESPLVGDVCLFLAKEAERARNIRYKYGRVIETNVDGRANKIRIKYKNADEAVFRELCRNVRDVILILSENDIDFGSSESRQIQELQKRHFLYCQQK